MIDPQSPQDNGKIIFFFFFCKSNSKLSYWIAMCGPYYTNTTDTKITTIINNDHTYPPWIVNFKMKKKNFLRNYPWLWLVGWLACLCCAVLCCVVWWTITIESNNWKNRQVSGRKFKQTIATRHTNSIVAIIARWLNSSIHKQYIHIGHGQIEIKIVLPFCF